MAIAISTRARITAAAAVVLAAGVATTFAAFTDSGNVQANLATGTFDLKFDDDQDGNPVAHAIEFSEGFDRLVPGSVVTRELTVFNSGNVEALLGLAAPTVVNSAGSPVQAVEDILQLEIRDRASGDVLYAGPLSGATITDLAIGANGTTATGTVLEMTATLPANATIAIAGQSIDVTFPFVAEQAI